MRKIFTLSIVYAAFAATAWAQKSVYIPDEWRIRTDTLLYSESDPDNKYTWSKSRSIESDNVIVFWDKGYGNTLPSKAPSAYRVDEQDLLKKCEAFYDLEINKLGFVDPETTNLRNYKVMVLLSHTTDWVCYGGGYDFEVSALWLGPSACKPVGHSVAHEVGHSFHYMCYADASGNSHYSSPSINTGFHLSCGNGQTIWEQTAQWQAAQSYPELMFDQSIGVFRKSHNYAFSHEWHRYQSYWFHYFINEYYDDITTVAQVWNQPMTKLENGEDQSNGNATDFNQALMVLKGLDAVALYRLYYDYAARCATWDLEACAPYRDPYIGDFDYRCVLIDDQEKTYQVALASTPQSTGFNVIPLEVPEAGTQITTHFTAIRQPANLAEGDPAEMMGGETSWIKLDRTTYITPSSPSKRAFRLGYVALMQDGSRQYFNEDSLYCQGRLDVTEDVTMTVPEGVSRLWLIVSPAPKAYVEHRWTEKVDNAEHWPYRFTLEGTDIGSRAVVYVQPTIDDRAIGDATFTYDLTFPRDTKAYSGTTVSVSGRAAATLGTAFQMQPTDIAGMMQTWSANGPSPGKVMFYAVNADGKLASSASTANGYGHWFNAAGKVGAYAAGYIYSEFDPATLTFTVGQYPGKCAEGSTYTIRQALRYRNADNQYAVATFIFNVTVGGQAASATLSNIEYEVDPEQTAVSSMRRQDGRERGLVYDLQGRQIDGSRTLSKGIYVVDGKKVVQK